MKHFNDWLALKITNGVATMSCAYLFAFIAILGFPYGSTSIPAYVQWLSQTFIQLTMLSIIMVGQKVMTDHHEDHAEKLDEVLKHVRPKE
jgi:hypothetical protein